MKQYKKALEAALECEIGDRLIDGVLLSMYRDLEAPEESSIKVTVADNQDLILLVGEQSIAKPFADVVEELRAILALKEEIASEVLRVLESEPDDPVGEITGLIMAKNLPMSLPKVEAASTGDRTFDVQVTHPPEIETTYTLSDLYRNLLDT